MTPYDRQYRDWLRYDANEPTRALHRREPLGFSRSDYCEKVDGEWAWLGADGTMKAWLGTSIDAAKRQIRRLP